MSEESSTNSSCCYNMLLGIQPGLSIGDAHLVPPINSNVDIQNQSFVMHQPGDCLFPNNFNQMVSRPNQEGMNSMHTVAKSFESAGDWSIYDVRSHESAVAPMPCQGQPNVVPYPSPHLLSPLSIQTAQLSPLQDEDILAALATDPLFTDQLADSVKTSTSLREGRTCPTFTLHSLTGELNNKCEILSGETQGDCHGNQLNKANTNVLTTLHAPYYNQTNADVYHGNQSSKLNTELFTPLHVPCSSQTSVSIVNEDNGQQNIDGKVKDTRYWNRRQKNNLAAKRSRAARREREIMNKSSIEQLRYENNALQEEVLFLRDENARLKRCLQGRNVEL